MVVFLTGASGFIGARVAAALAAASHEVVGAIRRPPTRAPDGVRYVHADMTADLDAAAWLPRLTSVDVAINAAGILRERGAQRFDTVHVRAPIALFEACVRAGVQRVIQISALGADPAAPSRYHSSKGAADEALATLPLDWVIVRPSLVYGAGGRSAALFDALASAPLVPLPGRGEQIVQPVLIDDLVAGVLALLADGAPRRTVIPFVGPRPLGLREFLAELRAALTLPPARFVSVPLALVRVAARAGRLRSRALLDSDTLAMLLSGNAGDARPFRELLGYSPAPPHAFVATQGAEATARAAKLRWLLPPLRASIALMWIGAGVVSLGLYPTSSSLAVLAAVGISNDALARLALYGAALLDIALGVATLALRRRELWLVQIGVIALYTAIISVRLPDLWLEPFGPVLKNVPVVAALWLLYEVDERR